MNDSGKTVRPHRQGRHQVEPEENEVRQVVAGQRFVSEVGVDEPQSTQPPPRNPLALQVGQFDAVRVSPPRPR